MKRYVCLAVFSLLAVCAPGGPANWTNDSYYTWFASGPTNWAHAVYYTPPTNFLGGAMPLTRSRNDPGDNPFSFNSPEFLLYENLDKNAAIIFRFALIGVYFGEGKIPHYLPVTPDLMKEAFERENKGRHPDMKPATLDTINGLTSVSLTALNSSGTPNRCRECWIQVQSNIVIKIYAVASDAETFRVVTNSLGTITVDKDNLIRALRGAPGRGAGGDRP